MEMLQTESLWRKQGGDISPGQYWYETKTPQIDEYLVDAI